MTIKVVLIFRKKVVSGNSIEVLFSTISTELKKYVNVTHYIVGSKKDILKDIFQLRRLNADIYHITGDCHYLAIFLPKAKTILTIHDINHYLYNLTGLRKIIYKLIWISLPMRFAAKITTISSTTKDNLFCEASGYNKDIIVIPNCFSPLLHRSPKEFNSECPVILQVGTAPHKNVSTLIEAIKDLSCKLVLIGKLSPELKQELVAGRVDFENYYGLDYDKLVNEYLKCDIVTFISLREGFGVPIIEAQAIGRVVITSNLEPMNSIAGSGAFIVDPYSVQSVRDAIIMAINDKEKRDHIVTNANNNVIGYSVDNVACQYHELYQKLTCLSYNR
ncbi:MAG: glycosyltransferase [Proteobacteria bacterium]|nr:MAG: glycosyltransferase [Pseudomonadota bacterium]